MGAGRRPEGRIDASLVCATSFSALALFFVASCGEEVKDTPEPIPASAAGPAQNWPEPEISEEIYEETEEGAEALLHYWWEVLNHARITGDTDLIEQFSGSSQSRV
ncbi:DUF6318 family protein [Nesterenkonia salmonea]|uniref:DUF6318 family protein n=1 Tax=Nesterenkonia salmonea TaxID=1804987 RepID=UPI0031334C2E